MTHINTLPAEILTQIFALSKVYCYRPHYEDFLSYFNTTAVCSYWRQIALDTPTLWTHVDVGPTIPTELTQLLLQRTKDQEMYLHVYEPKQEVSSQPENLEEASRKIISMLTPHIRRVCALQLQSFTGSAVFVSSVLNLWLNHGDAQTTRSLLINRPFFNEILSVDAPKPGACVSQSKNAKQVLLSVTTLHMGGSLLPWDCSAYRDLVELKLQFHRCKASASESQLASLLSANPRLATLKLAFLSITRTHGWTQPPPVLLSRLEVLDLVKIKPDDLELLLPLIAVPDSPGDLSVAVILDQRPQAALERFFSRSQMTTLYCYYPGYYLTPRPSLLRSLACVKTVLILKQLAFHGQADTIDVEPPPTPLASSIPDMILLSCEVTLEGLKNLVAEYRIRSLRLQHCKSPDRIHNSQTLQNIQNSLLAIYPNLQILIEDEDTTFDHPVRLWEKYNW
ncbi:hypothetical protein FRC12_017107 [Ceratobasidium sp. 428]|nr:hypothetical protein FRC12_017107 [Ceratobasidium sp. 428]